MQRTQPFANLFPLILANNLVVATLDALPYAGLLFFIVTAVNSDLGSSSLLVESHAIPIYGSLLFTGPFIHFELSVYFMGIVTGFYLWFEVIESNQRSRRNLMNALQL